MKNILLFHCFVFCFSQFTFAQKPNSNFSSYHVVPKENRVTSVVELCDSSYKWKWTNSAWTVQWKDIYTYDLNYNQVTDLYQNFALSSITLGLRSYDANNNETNIV